MSIRRSVPAYFATLVLVLPLSMAVTAFPAAAAQIQASSSLEGTWQGAVRQPNGSDNRWVVKVEKNSAAWKGTLWFIDQKSPPIPIDKVALNSGTLLLDIETIGISYEGKMAPCNLR